MKKQAVFKWSPLSRRQKKVMYWWTDNSPYNDFDGIIADGAVRSGKTVSMGFSFVLWAMTRYNGQDFALCGKTIGALKRNVLNTLKKQLVGRKYKVEHKRSENLIIVSKGNVTNNFYLFSGKDESSQDIIQGMTLAGVFFDEVALMPESFVNQATARCSVEGAKFWFNCNPAGPNHWFKVKWINRCKELRLIYLHFTMDDNLTLSQKVKDRYMRQYVGVFFRRYIFGLWVMAEGVVYSMFEPKKHTTKEEPELEGLWYVSADFGIQNPNVWLLWSKIKGTNTWYCSQEIVYSGKTKQKQKTVQELVDDLEQAIGDKPVKKIIIDPSAAALKAELRKRKYRVVGADNEVIDGIVDVQSMLQEERLLFNSACKNCKKEFQSYSWDPKASDRGEDKPMKVNDHCMDAIRYFVRTMKLVKRGDKAPSPKFKSYYE